MNDFDFILADVIVLTKPPSSLAISPGKISDIFVNAVSNPSLAIKYAWQFKENNGSEFTMENLPVFFRLSNDNKNLTINGTFMTPYTAYDVAGVLFINISNELSYKAFNVTITVNMDRNQG